MSSLEPNEARETTLLEDLRYTLRYYVVSRQGLLLIMAAAVVLGLMLNWQWLVTLGIAPLLLSLLPCAAMCALGLCLHKTGKGKNACSPNSNSTEKNNQPSNPARKPDDMA